VAEKNECESRLADDQREGDAEVYAKRQTYLARELGTEDSSCQDEFAGVSLAHQMPG
jgi:hypothetical protein